MTASFCLYAAAVITGLGLISLIVPLRFVGIRSRWIAAGLIVAGYIGISVTLSWPTETQTVAEKREAIDTFAPEYQFSERHSMLVRATPGQVYSAMKAVSADEIPTFREIVWIRRGGKSGPASIMNPPDGVSLLRLATESSFIILTDVPGREFVMGAVVLVPPGVKLALDSTPASFLALTQRGFAKATLSFRIEPVSRTSTRVVTETRVTANDAASTATFGRYWRVIAPGSALIRLMWLRAIKVRAETIAGAPVVRPPSVGWLAASRDNDLENRLAVSGPVVSTYLR